jgi:hypothetical protein
LLFVSCVLGGLTVVSNAVRRRPVCLGRPDRHLRDPPRAGPVVGVAAGSMGGGCRPARPRQRRRRVQRLLLVPAERLRRCRRGNPTAASEADHRRRPHQDGAGEGRATGPARDSERPHRRR